MKTLPKLVTFLSLVTLGVNTPVITHAGTFQATEVDQNRFVLVASPYGNNQHQLLIIEQVSNERECWRENGANPVNIEPLLLEFDFTGICARSVDSNGYSIRLNDEDLGWSYLLNIVRRGDELILMGTPTRDRQAPRLEIGSTQGMGNGFLKINLNPGWRLSRRTFENQTLGHLYLNGDLAAVNIPSPSPAPSTPSVPPASLPTPPPATLANPTPPAPTSFEEPLRELIFTPPSSSAPPANPLPPLPQPTVTPVTPPPTPSTPERRIPSF